jgi:hypothetical protein
VSHKPSRVTGQRPTLAFARGGLCAVWVLGAAAAWGQQPADAGVLTPDAGFPAVARSVSNVSSNERYAIRMERDAAGRCQVLGLRETQVVWKLPRCIGAPDDLFFIADNADRFWVLHTLPAKAPEPKGLKSPKWAAWHDTIVARELTRQGELVRTMRVRELMEPFDRTKIRQLGRHFKWLEGVVGVKGRSPRVTPANQVEFEVVGGRTVTLSF